MGRGAEEAATGSLPLNQPLALDLSVTPHCHLDNDQMPQHDSQTSIQTSVLPTLDPPWGGGGANTDSQKDGPSETLLCG